MASRIDVLQDVSVLGNAMTEIKGEREMAISKTFLPPLQREHIHRSNPEDNLYYEGPLRLMK